jgi:hypothetical protein
VKLGAEKMSRYWFLGSATLMVLVLWYCGQQEQSQVADYTGSRLAYLTERLQLTAPQAERIKAVLTEERNALQKLRYNNEEDRRALMRATRDRKSETDTLIVSHLDESQRETYSRLQKLGVNEDNIIELQAKLSLTPNQTDSVAKIFSDMRQEMQAMRGAGDRRPGGGNREGMMMGMRAMQEETDKAIAKVLNENQKQLYDKIQEERMEQMRRRFEGSRNRWE